MSDFKIETSSPSLPPMGFLGQGVHTVPSPAVAQGGKGGEGGVPIVTNAAFLAAICGNVSDGAVAAICSLGSGDPTEAHGWPASSATRVEDCCKPLHNNYFNCSSFHAEADGSLKARKGNFAACHALMLDDLGSKASLEELAGIELSWLIETSPGNHQGGIILDPPITDAAQATQLLDAIIGRGLCDPGASGPAARWARLPVGINGKPKYRSVSGAPFECRLVQWNPAKHYTVEEVVAVFQLDLTPAKPAMAKAPKSASRQHGDEVFTPKASENPVVSALKQRGLYKKPLGKGIHDITCPWVTEHTDGQDRGTAYFEPSDEFKRGGFCCQHSHGDQYRLGHLVEHLNLTSAEVRNRPEIRVVAGEMDRVVDAAEKVLADRGEHYQYGGLIVSISRDPITGDASILPTNLPALTMELAIAADWQKYDGRKDRWVRADPPVRHVAALYDAQTFRHLPALAGLARQPYFRESDDGGLITHAGYDPVSKRYGVFDSKEFVLRDPTHREANDALSLLMGLLGGFKFNAETDRAAALAAIFTAVVRTSLPHAPGFHAHAPVYGSGKTYLCELIGAFAGPGPNLKVSYPKSSEEATKSVLSLLMAGPAVVEFDDMDTDWVPHGVIKRMFTADRITDRVLGVSKTATVSTRTLFLGSGNNVGPVRDLLRRVVTIHIDPRCATPATLSYIGNPVETVRRERGRYVAAVLTIIRAWQAAGSPRNAPNIANYGGEWSDYCRHPLIWLGQPDPATALFDQIRADPDADALGTFMVEWRRALGSKFVTVRKAIATAEGKDLEDAMRELPVTDGQGINPSKLGWFLKKNANRIVGDYEFRKGTADGRTAWAVVYAGTQPEVRTPPSPALPPLRAADLETVAMDSTDDATADF